MAETTAITKLDETGLALNTTADLEAAVNMIVFSDMCPNQFKQKPKDAMIAILAGRAVGWAPMQSLQYIAVINGRPSLYGDGPTGLAYGSGKAEWEKEWWELDNKEADEPNYASLADYTDSLTACWQTKRKDASEPSPIRRFSVADAKMANLWCKKGPWQNYPKRMLTCRARAFGLRDNYSDALQGITQAEEWADIQTHHKVDPLEAADVIDVEAAKPIDLTPVMPTEADWEKFRKGLAKHRAGEADMTDDAFLLAVIKAEVGVESIKEVDRPGYDQLCEALADRRYDWATGQRIPTPEELEQLQADLDAQEQVSHE